MLTIAFVVAALAATAEPDDARFVVGPFTIISTVRKVNSFPYPEIVKTTGLQWTSADQLVTFDLRDSGTAIYASFSFKKNNSENTCYARSSPMRLQSEQTSLFDIKVATRWVCITGPQDSEAVAKTPEQAARPYATEIEVARQDFSKAYAVFLDQTHKLHGPSTARCLKFDYGIHGPFCTQRSDE